MLIVTRKATGLFLFFLLALSGPGRVQALDVGDAAKDFALPDTAGAIVTLNEATRGAPVTILEFLSVYCEACRKKAPYINRLAERYGPRGLRILAIALANDQQDTAGLIKDWGATYQVLPDPEKKTFYLYGIHKIPQLFILDGSGTIRYRSNGDSPKDLEKTLESLLAQKSDDGSVLNPGDKAPVVSLENIENGKTMVFPDRHAAALQVVAFFSSSDKANRKLARMLCTLAGQSIAAARIYGILPGAMEKSGPGLAGLCPDMPLLVDRQGEAFKKYSPSGTPELMILSRSGYVRKREAPQSLPELAALLKPTFAATATVDDKQLRQYLDQAMPGAASIRPVRIGDGGTVYIGDTAQGKRLARVVKKEILCEVCTDVFFILAIDEKGIFKNITLINPFELYGKQIDASAFTRQFIGKSFRQSFTAGKNADSITGATKSCAEFIEGLNETAGILASLKKPPFEAEFRKTICFLNQSELEEAQLLYQQKHGQNSKSTIKDLAPLCPGSRLPKCPDGGAYRITVFNGIARVLCSKHGLDPKSSIIH